MKFQVHSTSIFWIRSKNRNWEVATTPTRNFDSLLYPYPKVGWSFLFCAKMTAKDDPTISYCNLVAETSILAAWENIRKGGW